MGSYGCRRKGWNGLKILEKNTTVTTLEKTIFIDNIQLINWLKTNPMLMDFDLSNAEIFVNVPGGGDWSNMELEIDKDCPIVIKIKKIILLEK